MRYIFTLWATCLFFILSVNAQRQTNTPDRLLYFQYSLQNDKLILSWSITNNDVYNYFEVQKSNNGKDFTTAGIVFSTKKPDTEDYIFKGTSVDSLAYYRLKLVTINDQFTYSRIIVVKAKDSQLKDNSIKFLQNPVQGHIIFQYRAAAGDDYDVTVYHTSGIQLFQTKKSCSKGINTIVITSQNLLSNNHYILEVKNRTYRSTALFVKH